MATIYRLYSRKMEIYYQRKLGKCYYLIIHDHHLVKGSRVITLDKLTSTEIYSILISRAQNKPTSNTYFKNIHNDYSIDWTAIYMLPHLITYNTCMRSFQYKILNNVLKTKNFILLE